MNDTFCGNVSAFTFLTEHNFDFNKLFYEGIHYVSKEQEKNLEASNLIKKLKKRLTQEEIQEKAEFQSLWGQHEKIIEAGAQHSSSHRDQSNSVNVNIKFVKLKVYKYLEYFIEQKYPTLSVTFTYDQEYLPDREVLVITFHSSSEAETLKKKVDLKGPSDSVDIAGFRRVIDLLIDKEKTLITHNGFVDILHLYNRFVGPLPETNQQFRKTFKSSFKEVYDTKFMASNSNILFSSSVSTPYVEPAHDSREVLLGDARGEVGESGGEPGREGVHVQAGGHGGEQGGA